MLAKETAFLAVVESIEEEHPFGPLVKPAILQIALTTTTAITSN